VQEGWFRSFRTARPIGRNGEPLPWYTYACNLPVNCTLLLEPDADAYVAAITGRDPFDIVVVDGLERPRAAAAALDGLKDDGVIIWDNSDWPEFAEVLPRLQEHGFRNLDFAGLGPISRAGWRTSVLYRAGNCLGI
jgi:hypothetical protein